MHKILTAVLFMGNAVAAMAQSYPTKPISMIVPWPAGGPSDYVARKIQADMVKSLGQPLVVDNVGGASGALGVQKMLNATTDGYLITVASPIELIVAPMTMLAVKYKPEDVRVVAQIVKAPLVLLARKDLPANNIDELIALMAKADTKELVVGNGGLGSLFHLAAEKFGQMTGGRLTHVAYKGATPMITDLMGSQIDLAITVFAGSIPGTVAEGKFKVIGMATKAPLPKFPQHGALASHPKLAGFEFDSWASVVVPRNTPDAIANRLNKATYDALQNPDTRAAFESSGNIVVNATSVEQLDQVYRSEIARYVAIAKSINFQPQ